METNKNQLMPKYPTFTDDMVITCAQKKDYRPMLFEWFKYIGLLCNTFASISSDSPALRRIPTTHYAVLIGLLNRCSRLMLSTTFLSSTRKYGETTQLLGRCISETAVKIQWLCTTDNSKGFILYIADGLKKDLKLKNQIQENISDRNGKSQIIEKRMLDSIEKYVRLSGLSDEEIQSAKPLPSFNQMCKDLELAEIFYTAIQRMGSHAVHGTWSDLIQNYLSYVNGNQFSLRDHDVDTQDAQFLVVMHLVLTSMKSFIKFIASDVSGDKDISQILKHVEVCEKKIRGIQESAWESDFEIYSE